MQFHVTVGADDVEAEVPGVVVVDVVEAVPEVAGLLVGTAATVRFSSSGRS